jgi:hypothetical protein
MPDEKPIPDAKEQVDQARDWDGMEREVLYLLTDADRCPTIWSIEDLGRELNYFDPESLVYSLRNAGLVYSTSDGFVFATAAAFRMVRLTGQVV